MVGPLDWQCYSWNIVLEGEQCISLTFTARSCAALHHPQSLPRTVDRDRPPPGCSGRQLQTDFGAGVRAQPPVPGLQGQAPSPLPQPPTARAEGLRRRTHRTPRPSRAADGAQRSPAAPAAPRNGSLPAGCTPGCLGPAPPGGPGAVPGRGTPPRSWSLTRWPAPSESSARGRRAAGSPNGASAARHRGSRRAHRPRPPRPAARRLRPSTPTFPQARLDSSLSPPRRSAACGARRPARSGAQCAPPPCPAVPRGGGRAASAEAWGRPHVRRLRQSGPPAGRPPPPPPPSRAAREPAAWRGGAGGMLGRSGGCAGRKLAWEAGGNKRVGAEFGSAEGREAQTLLLGGCAPPPRPRGRRGAGLAAAPLHESAPQDRRAPAAAGKPPAGRVPPRPESRRSRWGRRRSPAPELRV